MAFFLSALNEISNFLFCLISLGFAIITSLLIPITNEVWDDLSMSMMGISIISSIITILLSINLFFKGKIWGKIWAIIFILILIIFEYIGIREFITIF